MAIVFDIDDTLFDTRSEIVSCFADFGFNANHITGYVTKFNAPEDILNKVLARAKFMTTGKLFEGAFNLMERLIDDGQDVRICTHRGYHEKGLEYTLDQLNDCGILGYLVPSENVYCLDPAVNKDKFAFLDSTIGAPYVLVDDNPSQSGSIGKYGTLVVFDRGWNQDSLLTPRIMGYDEYSDAFLKTQLEKSKRRAQCLSL